MHDQIHQTIQLPASPEAVYEQLTDAAKFSAMSGGAPAEVDPEAGGAFALFGGMIEGRNVECLPGRRLVQAWRAKSWDAGVYSLVRFELEAGPDGGTRLVMDHAAFPEGQAEHLDAGWHANYWKPMVAALTAG